MLKVIWQRTVTQGLAVKLPVNHLPSFCEERHLDVTGRIKNLGTPLARLFLFITRLFIALALPHVGAIETVYEGTVGAHF